MSHLIKLTRRQQVILLAALLDLIALAAPKIQADHEDDQDTADGFTNGHQDSTSPANLDYNIKIR